MLNILCRYDMEIEDVGGRMAYIFRADKQRIRFLMFCIVFGMALTKLFIGYHYGPLKVIRYLLLLAVLYPIAREDAREKKIPNRWLLYLLTGRGILLAVEMISFPSMIVDNIKFILFGGAMSGIIFFLAYVLSRHAIGMGDVKLAAVIGTCLGFRTTYLAMLAASILSAVYGGIMMLQKKKGMRDEIAFAPFIALGTFIVLLIGA